MLPDLVYYGDPILRKKAALVTEINEEIRQLVKDMHEMVIKYDGLGIAAPQVGRSLALFVTLVPVEKQKGVWEPGTFRVFINPKLSHPGVQKDVREEGCLSLPNLYGPVERPLSIVVEAQDLEGNFFKQEFFGYEARCIMHENDHINGVLYIDRVLPKFKNDVMRQLNKLKKDYPKPKKH